MKLRLVEAGLLTAGGQFILYALAFTLGLNNLFVLVGTIGSSLLISLAFLYYTIIEKLTYEQFLYKDEVVGQLTFLGGYMMVFGMFGALGSYGDVGSDSLSRPLPFTQSLTVGLAVGMLLGGVLSLVLVDNTRLFRINFLVLEIGSLVGILYLTVPSLQTTTLSPLEWLALFGGISLIFGGIVRVIRKLRD